MLMDKDEALASACRGMAAATGEALKWIADNAKLVGAVRPDLERVLKRQLVETRRLATAAARPMSAAVFGPSQAGKSFLIGKFITPPGRPAMAVFGSGIEQEKLDFLTQVNPQGGKETTGLVTRFSLTPLATPPGFPVVLRLLREVDLVKILINSFLFDLSGHFQDGEPLTPAWVHRLVGELRPRALTMPQPGLSAEDVLELREYLTESLATHPYIQSPGLVDAYWPAMETLLPLLDGPARLQALSPLWGRLAEFNALYEELKAALDLLGHAGMAYVPMEAIRDTALGVLHVDRIYELAESGGPGAQPVAVALDGGGRASLRKSVVTALTLELRITLDSAPWPFLTHTDLLDFPGARSREGSTPEKYLRRQFKPGSEKPPREYCFLRGKVAVLFDNYVADLDLNAMLLCIPDSNLEVRTLPELVNGWVRRTHGATPAERVRRNITSLLFCMTKCDRLFDLAAGATLTHQVENRFRTNLDDFAGWMTEWHPGRAFDNIFMLRNPKAVEQLGIFAYVGPTEDRRVRDEAGFAEDFQNRLLPAFREALHGNATVKTHVANLEQKLQALVALNDGGTSYLAQALTPVCDPDLKREQILPRARRVAEDILQRLSAYFDEEDIKARVDRRLLAVKGAFAAMVEAANPPLGLLLAELGVEEAVLRQAYFDFARSDRLDEGATPQDSIRQKPADNGFGLDLDSLDDLVPGLVSPPPAADHFNRRNTYGALAVSRWLEGLRQRAADPFVLERLGLRPEQFLVLVDELDSGTRRLRLAERIDSHADIVISYRQSLTATAAAAALGAAARINDYVSDAGRRLMEQDADPDQAALARRAFSPPPQLAPGQMPDLPVDEKAAREMHRQFPREWLQAFLALTRENASSNAGRLIDPEQNDRLGKILTAFRM